MASWRIGLLTVLLVGGTCISFNFRMQPRETQCFYDMICTPGFQ